MEQISQPRIPVPSQALLDTAMRNARSERSQAAHRFFGAIARAVRDLLGNTSAIGNGAATR